MSFRRTTVCRSCGSGDLFGVLDLGEQPPANALRRPDDESPEPSYPLAVVGCPSCSLVQLSGTLDPALLFDDYPYFSSYSTTMVERMGELARRLVAERSLGGDDLVLEVASNDGYLLRHYAEAGVRVLGVDPARNVAAVAEERGVPTVVDYFGLAVAERVVFDAGRASVVHANNVLAHVPEVNDVVAGVAAVLAPDGVAVIETPSLTSLVDHVEFDTIYHEHVFYYSLSALHVLFARHGLTIVDVEHLDIHGGSFRVFAAHEGEPSADVREVLAAEAERGLDRPAAYAGLAEHVGTVRRELVAFLEARRDEGALVAAYGAAAKGAVLLNHFGIGTDLIAFVVDRSPHKQGLLMPGVHLPIRPPEALLDERPAYTVLLAWNFADEILAQQQAYRDAGGRFVVPLPVLEVR